MIPDTFFAYPAEQVARGLLGMMLVHATPDGTTAGKIVETEAYHEEDPAAHSFNGKTERNAVMFGPPGRIYVYFTYGMHHCFNIVTGTAGKGEAVLIRAVEPLHGISLMRTRRGRREDLCNGPARLVQAFSITKEHNGLPLTGNLQILQGENPKQVVQTTRIGITKGTELPLRFYIKNNPYVSRKEYL